MKYPINLRRIAACIVVIVPVAILVLTTATQKDARHARGMRGSVGARLVHCAASGRRGHLIGWVNHLVGSFASIAANL